MPSRGSSLLQLSFKASHASSLSARTVAKPFLPFVSRCLSTGSARPSIPISPFRLDKIYPQARAAPWNLAQKRFAGSSSSSLLAHMEQTANNNPTSATAQNAFYAALLRANMPAIVVERYQTGRYATNAACQSTYLRALERLGGGTDGTVGGIAGGASLGYGAQQSSSLSGETLQSVAQAIAARSNGGSASMNTRVGDNTGQGSKKAPIYVVTDESWGQAIFKWAKMLLYFGLFVYVILIAVHLAVDATGVLRRTTGAQHVEASKQKARFSDVQGCDLAKEELQELVDFLKDPESFVKLGGKLPKGVLLTGPPGTGKTLLARATAGEADVPFFYMAGSEFDEVYVGVGAKRIRELFQAARSKSPSIIFIDELDAVGGKRSEKEASYHKQTLNQLLTEMDGFEQDSGVIVIGATNFPKSLDKALTRPGRFDRNVHVELPDVRGRMAILEYYLKGKKVEAGYDASRIARRSSGLSGADLENLINQAAVRASKHKQSEITSMDLEWAFDKIVMGPENKTKVIKEEDKLNTAYHEAGHALVALFEPHTMELHKVTIIPRGQSLGVTQFLPAMDRVSQTRAEALAQISVLMGGKAAEFILMGPDGVTSGAGSDIEQATNAARAAVHHSGFSDVLGNVSLDVNYMANETKLLVDEEVKRIIEDGYKRAKELLRERRKELDLLAAALVKHELLDAEEVRRVIRGEQLPDKLNEDNGRSSGEVTLPEVRLPPMPIPAPGVHTSHSDQAAKAERNAMVQPGQSRRE